MDFPKLCLAGSGVDGRLGDLLKEARTRHILREACLAQGRGLGRPMRWLVYRLGYLLVTLGHWLERFEVSTDRRYSVRHSHSGRS